jgi:RNA polymerase sigma-70 factor (ECF subfamily)
VNLSRDGLRRRRTVRRTPMPAIGFADPADVGAVLDEDQRELAAALRSLPERQRECVVLRYLLELSTADTAETLGITSGSVKTHLSRGLAALHAALEGTR